MEDNSSSDQRHRTSSIRYDRSFKQRCFEEVLEHYGSFLNIANYPEDIKLIFLLTMCRMIDKAKSLPDENVALHENETVYANDYDTGPPVQTRNAFSLVSSTAPWNLTALLANQQRLFSRYKFDGRADEATNAKEFIDRLLDQPDDSTARFV